MSTRLPRARRDYVVKISPETIAWAIKEHRQTVTAAAQHMRIDRRTLQRWMNGSHQPRDGLQKQAILSYIYGALKNERERNQE